MLLSPLLRPYDHVLLDLDGCVWVGDAPLPGAVEAVAAIRASGKGVAFVTNNAMHPAEDFVRRLWGMGFQAAVEDVVTSGGAVQHVLAERPDLRHAFVIGAPALHRSVEASGTSVLNGTDLESRADVVVVAAHVGFDFAELRAATLAINRGALMIATDADASYPMADGLHPGTGALVAALETATGVRAQVVGKPAPQVFRTALDRLGPGRALVVGDRLDADAAGAHAAGLDAAIVLTGTTTREEAQAWEQPLVAIADSLGDLVLGVGPTDPPR